MRSRSKHEASVHFRPLKSESRKRLSDRQVRSGLDSNLTTQCDVPFTPMLSIHKTNQPPPTATPCRRHHLNRELPDRVMQPTPPLSLSSSLAAAPRFRFSLFPDPKSPKSSVHNFRGKNIPASFFLSFFLLQIGTPEVKRDSGTEFQIPFSPQSVLGRRLVRRRSPTLSVTNERVQTDDSLYTYYDVRHNARQTFFLLLAAAAYDSHNKSSHTG